MGYTRPPSLSDASGMRNCPRSLMRAPGQTLATSRRTRPRFLGGSRRRHPLNWPGPLSWPDGYPAERPYLVFV